MILFPRASLAAATLAAAAVLAQPAAAEMVQYMADLSGANGVPPIDTAATGHADVTVDTDAMTVAWTVTYEGLSGEPTAAHFHGPASATETAPPVVDIFASLADGSAPITAEQWDQLQAGMWYLNIHTNQYPDGEIRGQVVPADAAQ